MRLWSEPKDAAHIHDMLEALRLLHDLIEGESESAFLADKSKPHALAMFVIMLVEAANKVRPAMQRARPDISWRRIANLRHIIAHEYRRIDHSELWRIATSDDPKLRALLPSPPSPPVIL